MIFTARLKALESEKEALTAETQRLLTRAEQAEQAAQTHLESLNALTEERNALTASIDTLTGERNAAVERAEKAEASVGTKVVERIASAGVPAIERAPEAKGQGETAEAVTLTFEEFNALTPAAKVEHFRHGGKLS